MTERNLQLLVLWMEAVCQCRLRTWTYFVCASSPGGLWAFLPDVLLLTKAAMKIFNSLSAGEDRGSKNQRWKELAFKIRVFFCISSNQISCSCEVQPEINIEQKLHFPHLVRALFNTPPQLQAITSITLDYLLVCDMWLSLQAIMGQVLWGQTQRATHPQGSGRVHASYG